VLVIKFLREIAANPKAMPDFLHALVEKLLSICNRKDFLSGDAPKNSPSFNRLVCNRHQILKKKKKSLNDV
jgi:hypothetical protein